MIPPSSQRVEFEWSVEPTVIYRRDQRIALLHVQKLSRPAQAAIEVGATEAAGIFDMTQAIDLGILPKGDSVREFEVPAPKKETALRVTLILGGRSQTKTITIGPARQWTIPVFHHSHCDVGFTHTPTQVMHLHNRYTDSAIEYCRASANWDPDARFKWVVETAWQAQNYLRMKPAAQVQEFLRLVRQGRIEISALYLGEHLDNLGNEALIRSIYYGGELRRKHGLPITSAMLCDVTGFPWQFGQILARAGIRYFHWAPNGFASAFFHHHKLKRPFRWEAPDGSRTLVWHTDDPKWGYIEGQRWGMGAGVERIRNSFHKKLAGLEEQKYPYAIFPLEVACDNMPPMLQVAENIRDWNKRYTSPRFVMSTVTEYFEALEREYGAQFPVARGDMNNYWSRLITSYPYEASMECDTRERLQRLERAGAVLAMVPGGAPPAQEQIGRAYDDVLVFEEHSGTGTIWKCKSDRDQRNALKQGLEYAYRARDLSGKLAAQAAKSLGALIPASGSKSFAVWNTLFHKRDALVEIPMQGSRLGDGNAFHLEPVGQPDEKLPIQIVKPRSARENPRVLFPAAQLPSYGYRCYILKAGAAEQKGAVEAGDGWLENRFYRLELNPYTGEIASLYDKDLERDLVGTGAAHRFTEVIYYMPELKHVVPMGGNLTEFADMYSPGPLPGKTRRMPRPKTKRCDFRVLESGPLRARILVPPAPISKPMLRREYVLYRNEKRLDLQLLAMPLVGRLSASEEILRSMAGVSYLSFPFQVPDGRFLLDYGHGTLRPIADQLPGACLDHYSMGHWCGLSNSDFGILFASRNMPKVELGEPHCVKFLHDPAPFGPAIYVPIGGHYRKRPQAAKKGLLDDIRPERQGPVPLQFSISSHKGRTRPADAMRWGWEAANPPEAFLLKQKQAPLPADMATFCECKSSTIAVSHAKVAEDGNGIILRLWEVAGKADQITLRFPRWQVAKVWKTSILEENEKEISCEGDSISLNLGPQEIATLRIQNK